MMDDNTVRNQRQFRLMLDAVGRYERGEIGLGRLVSDLESLLDALDNLSEEWRDSFLGEWGDLEQVHAVALDRSENQLNDQESRLVGDSLKAIRAMVQAALETPDARQRLRGGRSQRRPPQAFRAGA